MRFVVSFLVWKSAKSFLCLELKFAFCYSVQIACVINPFFYVLLLVLPQKDILDHFFELVSEMRITFVFCDTYKSFVILLGCAQLAFCYYLLYMISLHIIPGLSAKLSVLSPQNSIVQFIVIVLFVCLYFLARVQLLWKLFCWVQFNLA